VKSVLSSSYRNFQILVVDNGSREEDYINLQEAFRTEQKISILRIEKNCGYVGGINVGLKHIANTDVEFIVIMNNDTVIDENAIENAVKKSQKYSNSIIAGKVYFYDKPNCFQTTGSVYVDRKRLKENYPGRYQEDTGQFLNDEPRDMLDDIFWIMPRKIIDDVGYYSTHFFLYGEQVDFALRAVQKGYRLMFSPDIKIWHKVSATTGGGDNAAPHVTYWRHKSSVVLLYKHTAFHILLELLLKTNVKLILKFIFQSNDRKIFKAALRGQWDGFKWLFTKSQDNGLNPYLKKK